MMIKEASKYLGIGANERLSLIEHYNKFCLPQVKKERRYKMGPNDEWCAMFVSVIANKCGLNADMFPYEVSVYYQTQIAKNRGLFTTKVCSVLPNDLIVYDWEGAGVLSHIGFVACVEKDKITALEGNINGTVGYRTTSKGHPFIAGFIKNPHAWDIESNQPLSAALHRIQSLASRTLRGEFGNGLERIKRLGTDYDAVQSLINGGWRG